MANWQPGEQRNIIQKVPLWLRKVRHTSDVYDPKVVSFGPYHHAKPAKPAKPELQFCQDAKRRTLEMFVAGSDRGVEFFKTEVLREVEYARSCYVDGSTDKFTDEEFAEMMLLDACFLLYLMDIFDEKNGVLYRHLDNYLGILVSTLAFQDLLLLENQIPFRILTLLITLRYEEKDGEEALLNILHNAVWPVWADSKDDEVLEMVKKIRDDRLKNPPLHLLEALHRVVLWDSDPDPQPRVTISTFRSATALKEKGIHFRPSKKRSLKSISFKSFTFSGQLELPVWFLTCHSKVFFLNMIAYEFCPCSSNVSKRVTSYLTFMKSLIENAADVKELREKRILLTSLGSDDDVVEFYRKLDTFDIGGFLSFPEVKEGIQKHYDSKIKTWKAELIHAYLGSPWSIIAWVAALLLIVLTILQTYYTMYK